MNYFKKLREEKIKEFRSHCRELFLDMYDSDNIVIDSNFMRDLRCNSYEHNLLMTKWDDDILIEQTKIYLEEACREFDRTDEFVLDHSYNEVLKHKIIHMLLERLEKYVEEKNNELV